MKLAADPEAAAWLDGLQGEREDFEWDAGNRFKLRKHDVEPEDVESMFGSAIVFAGRILEPPHDEPRWLVLGRSGGGRPLALILTRRGLRLRPIACRSMRRNEGRLYEEATRETEGRES